MSNPIPKIILDTDPGGDDIVALFWLQSLVRQGWVELVAVTTAEGNVSAPQTFAAASKILTLGGLNQIEVGRGVPVHQPDLDDASHIHGTDGMGHLSQTLPDGVHGFETARYSDEILIDALNAAPGEITILAIAPLNNLAAAETKNPGILKKAKEIVLMAGAFQCPGNVTPVAEFNVAYNPEAAQVVFDSRDDIVVVPLDITTQLVFTEPMIEAIVKVNPERAIARFLKDLWGFMTSTALQYRETKGVEGFLVHDAALISYLVYPETLCFRRAKVSIEVQGQWTKGQTLIDYRHTAKLGANAWVAVQVDAPKFFMHLIEDLRQLLL